VAPLGGSLMWPRWRDPHFGPPREILNVAPQGDPQCGPPRGILNVAPQGDPQCGPARGSHLSEFEFIFETVLEHESGGWRKCFDKKNQEQNFPCQCPFKLLLPKISSKCVHSISYECHRTIHRHRYSRFGCYVMHPSQVHSWASLDQNLMALNVNR
jgi:hypothetical protein